MVDAGERLRVLLKQEAVIYQTTDYLTRMSLNGIAVGGISGHHHQQQSSPPSSPNKRKSSGDLTTAEDDDVKDQSSSSLLRSAASTVHDHNRRCRNRKWKPTPSTQANTTSSSTGGVPTGTGDCSAAATSKTNGSGSASVGSSSSSTTITGKETTLNKHWREKICEWAYQGKNQKPYNWIFRVLLFVYPSYLISSHLILSVCCCFPSLFQQTKPKQTVVDHFDLNREVVGVAMNHLDRYLGSYEGIVDKNLFQLLAMTCLYIAIKLNEYKHLLIPGSKSSMDTILQLSRGFFTLEEMEKMEYEVLQRLQWYVHPPTSQIFMKHFLFFLSVEENELHDLAQFMIELSVMDYYFVSYRPSEIALAALLNSMEKLKIHTSTIQFPFNYLDFHAPAVLACRERLSLIHAQANEQATEEKDKAGSATATPKTAGSDHAVPEPARLQRTISPVSVMAGPVEEQQKDHVRYASSPYTTSSTTGTKHSVHPHQELIDTMDTDEGYFYGNSAVEEDCDDYYS